MSPNGIEYSEFQKFQKTDNLANNRICFMVAYYHPYKGIKLANSVFGILKAKGFKTVEISVTGGPLPNTMEYHHNPSVEDKCKIIAGCQVMFHPSVFETWNLVSMESMALGTPVVGVNSKGIMEYAKLSGADRNIIIFEERDPETIANAIVKLCEERKEYGILQKNGIETARGHDWNTIMPGIESSYALLADRIEVEYQLACDGIIAEDIREHIATLRRYATYCDTIVELGVRTGASTRAFLAAKPKSLLSVDIIPIATDVSKLKSMVKDTKWEYLQADDLKIDIPETDMLFIDTYHTGEQLRQELELHADRAKKYIILHDTETWGTFGHGGVPGLISALTPFLIKNSHWLVKEKFSNNNGLTVLERI